MTEIALAGAVVYAIRVLLWWRPSWKGRPDWHKTAVSVVGALVCGVAIRHDEVVGALWAVISQALLQQIVHDLTHTAAPRLGRGPVR